MDTECIGLVPCAGQMGVAWYPKAAARTVRLGGVDLSMPFACEAAGLCREDLAKGVTASAITGLMDLLKGKAKGARAGGPSHDQARGRPAHAK